MRNRLFTIGCLSMLLLAFAGCSDNEESKDIVLTGGTQTSQTIYADQTTGDTGGIRFTAVADWTATVTEVATRTKAGGSNVDWLTLSAYSGGAGEYTLTMTLSENLTGQDRKAKIEIRCGATTLTITVEQKATTEEGDTPTVPVVPAGDRISRLEYTSIASENPDYYTKIILTFAYNGEGRLAEMHDIVYYGDEQAYYSDDTYTFAYEEGKMGIVRASDDEYSDPRTYTALLDEAGRVATFYREPTDSYSTTVEAWFYHYDADGYLQQITYDYNYEPGGGDGDGDDEDAEVAPDYGPGTRSSDNLVLDFTWKDGNLMSTIGDEWSSDGNWMEWEYTSYLNETPGLDFNVMSSRNLFGYHDMRSYDDLTNMLFGLRMLGNNSKNLVKTDLVNWSYDAGSGTKASTEEHEDTWAPYEYTFTPDNYLDKVTARCTLKTFVDGELTNTTYIDDEYLFTYE